MPSFDGTGPRGFGPMTGRGLGPCGRGLAFRRGGRGFGRGYGRWYLDRPVEQSLSKEDEKKILEAELKELDAEKEDIVKRLKELE